ncbi:hypothetical protein FOCC_FOCC008675 [Frankliniella occidentalis]|uniref:Protein roadkill-like n=1 Tax=Frankliniella occidentalis TaxID=133901 RepID=A0A9C6U954_FRAOC|nr:protein roadkill-like [Frankliniella occidentalis]KAE8744672.1 hypothetical protein FOCC_FOCC008675 [Frankliniella occidentalis]
MALSTTNVDFSIPIPAPGSKYHLDSPDSKWTWSLEIPQISGSSSSWFSADLFLTVRDKTCPASKRLVTWGGAIVAGKLIGKGELELSKRFLQTPYKLANLQWYHHTMGIRFSGKLEVLYEMSAPIPSEKPNLIAAGGTHGTASLSKSLGSLLDSGLLSDVKLCTEGQEVLAHRSILAARSEFFKTKFKPEWDGHTVDVDVELPVLKEMLRYIYTGSLGDNVDMVKLLVAADMYLVSDLCDEVSERLKHYLSSNIKSAISVCCDLLKTSATLNCPTLWKVVLRYLKLHRDQVLKSREWMDFQTTNRQTAGEAMLDMYNLLD